MCRHLANITERSVLARGRCAPPLPFEQHVIGCRVRSAARLPPLATVPRPRPFTATSTASVGGRRQRGGAAGDLRVQWTSPRTLRRRRQTVDDRVASAAVARLLGVPRTSTAGLDRRDPVGGGGGYRTQKDVRIGAA